MTASEWRLWFITERLHLHDLLRECIEVSDTLDQKVGALYEHDSTLHNLARHARKRITRADLVSLFACRESKLSSEQTNQETPP